MRTKSMIFFPFTSQCDYDVYVFVETWLNSDFFNEEFFDTRKFNVFRKDRDYVLSGCSRGGGVLIAVNSSFVSKQIALSDGNLLLDQLCVEIQSIQGNFFICASYIPPNSTDSLYQAHSKNILHISDSLNYNDKMCILGDFNLNNIFWAEVQNTHKFLPCNVNKSFEVEFIDALLSIGLQQINKVFNNLKRLLDLVFVSSDIWFSAVKCNFPVSPETVHHSAICINLQFYNFSNSQIPALVVDYDYNSCNFNLLNELLAEINWPVVLDSNVVAVCYEEFIKRINFIVEENISRMKPKVYKLPWYTRGLKKLKNLRNKFYSKFMTSNSSVDEKLYIHYMREFNCLNKFLYNQYILSYSESLKNNPRRFFSYIKSKNNNSSVPKGVMLNNIVSNSPRESVDLFKTFFESNFTEDNSVNNFNNFNNILPCVDIGSIDVCDEDILSAISKLTNSFKSDLHGISSFLLKNCSTAFVVPLKILFQKSLSSGYFIQKWKTATVFPVFKSGDKTLVTNYRPISKLPNIAKVFEHIMHDKFFFLIKRHINPNQHGFVSGRSTTTNLAVFTNLCLNEFESGVQVDTIYTDFSKAFDRVRHDILLLKLHKFGFHSNVLNWLRSYLCNRVCTVCVDGYYSSSYFPTSGVPQGSILGPLLFNIFVNDISMCLKNSKHLMYADDLKIFKSIHTLNDVVLLQEDLDRIAIWSKVNDLPFNTNKCFKLTFHRCKTTINSSYHIYYQNLEEIFEYSDLGVVFDYKFSFKSHIDFIICKAYSMFYFIRRNISKFSDPYTKKALFSAFVRSKLEYASLIWNPVAAVHSLRIEKVQKVFLKYALSSISFTLPVPTYESRCALISLQTLEVRRNIASIMFLHSIVSGYIDCPMLLSLIRFNAPSRSLRRMYTFNIEMHATNYASNEPINRSMVFFNTFCNNIDFCLPQHNFKEVLCNLLN